MIDALGVEQAWVDGLSAFVARRWSGRAPALVCGDRAAPAPAYPYLSYTVTTLLQEVPGSWCVEADGSAAKEARMTVSLTALAERAADAMALALLARDWLAVRGSAELSDAGLVVARVTAVGCRDQFLGVDYERRCGFDFTLAVMDRIPAAGEDEGAGWIERARVTEAKRVDTR